MFSKFSPFQQGDSRQFGVRPSPHRQAFSVTRRQLALWYTSATTIILLASGLVIYALVAHACWLSLEREMQSLAVFMENQLEPVLTEAGQLDQTARQRFPELCVYGHAGYCVPANVAPALPYSTDSAQISPMLYQRQQADVCIRLLDLAHRPVAWFRLSSSPASCQNPQWQGLKDSEGHYYHRIVYPLHRSPQDGSQTTAQTAWGSIQIIQSLNDLDIYMLWIEIALVATILAAILAAGFASWQLAKLAMRPVQYSYEQMEQFTADAAHELRSPITSLRAIVQTALRSQELSPCEIRETLQILNRQSQRLSSLVQDLLLFSQIESAATGSSFRRCSLDQILAEIIDEFMVIAVASDINLTYQILSPQVFQVLGNPEQLHRAIANLISNALNYTAASGQITVTLTATSTHAQIQVQDTGIGIALEEQARIFDRFYRGNPDRSCRSGGAGLGLSIAQSIVQAHQGTLTVQSAVGQGSQFTLSLPLEKVGNGPTSGASFQV